MTGPAVAEKAQDSPTAAGGSNPEIFVGKWTDTLGHKVTVEPTNAGGKILATLVRPDGRGRPKTLRIQPDQRAKSWRCGNGTLSQVGYQKGHREAGAKPVALAWSTGDGRVSTWTRAELGFRAASPEAETSASSSSSGDEVVASKVKSQSSPKSWRDGAKAHASGKW